MLQYDKQLIISAAGSRKATHWPVQKLLWSEFLTRLASPTRSTETLMEYLRLPKSRQDELKDVGGFVGGTLEGGRRKATAVTGRDIVTLDFDAIQPMETMNVLKRLDTLAINLGTYSTRKHEPVRPRLRVLIPLSRTVTADEYEPLARKLAEFIGIEMCDPTTFEASRLMYWPSVCAGAEYIFQYYDRPFVDVDAVLAMYADWRDVTSWPQVPGAQKAQQRLVQKQENPTDKSGIIGAFCRTYDVYQAMETFIPGAYEPVAGDDARYTFVGGSTTGGAVIYDNGLYLFSHHATDPASGRLVNAFDLVRLHRFGDLDDEAKEGTPTGKLPSYAEMCKLAMEDPTVGPMVQKERGEAILADFGGGDMPLEAPEGETLAEFLGKLKGAFLTTRMVRDLLKALGVRTRLNMITGAADITGYPSNWSRENAENNLPTLLLDLLKPAEVKGANKNSVCDCLDVVADEDRYNPVEDMMKSTIWDGIDRLPDVYHMLGVFDPLDRTLIRKWLHQCTAMACNDPINPWGADGVLTLSGPQGIGKTSAVKMLSPLPELVKEGATIDPRVPDTITQALRKWITELGELDRTTAKDHVSLKALITTAKDEYRTPYARKAVTRVRRTSFCGTVNTDDFLIDDTGNRRFWVIKVHKIDLPYLFSRTDAWKRQLWSQMYQAFLVDSTGYRLTGPERGVLDTRNREYTKGLDYEAEVRALLDYDIPETEWPELTATQVCNRISPKPPGNRVGRVLAKLAIEDERISRRMRHGVAVYRLPIVKLPDFAG